MKLGPNPFGLTQEEIDLMTILATGAKRREAAELLDCDETSIQRAVVRVIAKTRARSTMHAVSLLSAIGTIAASDVVSFQKEQS